MRSDGPTAASFEDVFGPDARPYCTPRARPPFTDMSGHGDTPAHGVSAERADDSHLARSEEQGHPAFWAAAVHVGGVTGFACFDGLANEVWCAQSADDASLSFVRLCVAHAQPRTIYASSKSSDEFLDALAEALADTAAPCGAVEVKLESSTLFSLDAARRRLCCTRIDAIAGAQHSVHALNSLVRLDAEAQVRATGALIALLQREGLLMSSLALVRERALAGFLTVDESSMAALGIFSLEAHPNRMMGTGGAKEGLSVFGLFDTTLTPAGKRLLRAWFKRPLVDVQAVCERQEAVAWLLCNEEDAAALAGALRRVKDLPALLMRLRTVAAFTPKKSWQALLDSLAALAQVQEALDCGAAALGETDKVKGMGVHPPDATRLFQRLAAAIHQPALRAVYDLVGGVIDFRPDEEQDAGAETSQATAMVAPEVSEELDQLKDQYAALPELLTQVAELQLERIPAGAARPGGVSLSVSYIPKVGHAVRLQGPGTRPLRADLAAALPDYEFAFEGETEEGWGTFYFADCSRGLDARFGDLYHRILDLEGALLTDLKKRVLLHAPHLLAAVAAASEADCLLAFTRAAHSFDLCRPQLTNDNVLLIQGGRHLLQERVADVFIPNDTDVRADSGRVNIVTGPNGSGKSVYLKQVALIVFLAHTGAFVPAQSARIGTTDRIFTRLASAEAVCAPVQQSSFMRDLHQVALAVRHATARSLLIVDEFGKGTLATDGTGLLCATVEYLLAREVPPRTFVATHFTECADPAVLARHPALAFHVMTVLTVAKGATGAAATSSDDITFLFRLTSGHAASSYGLHCAKLAHVPPSVLARAAEVAAAQQAGRPVPVRADAQMGARTQRFAAMVQALIQFDPDGQGDPRAFLKDVCMPPRQKEEEEDAQAGPDSPAPAE